MVLPMPVYKVAIGEVETMVRCPQDCQTMKRVLLAQLVNRLKLLFEVEKLDKR